jgi:hypothetical protein
VALQSEGDWRIYAVEAEQYGEMIIQPHKIANNASEAAPTWSFVKFQRIR